MGLVNIVHSECKDSRPIMRVQKQISEEGLNEKKSYTFFGIIHGIV